jgi:hypothetical protein
VHCLPNLLLVNAPNGAVIRDFAPLAGVAMTLIRHLLTTLNQFKG